jgi:hypothetical protein
LWLKAVRRRRIKVAFKQAQPWAMLLTSRADWLRTIDLDGSANIHEWQEVLGLPRAPPGEWSLPYAPSSNEFPCVRWQVTAIARNGDPYEGSCVAIYRFENGRIVEDWAIVAPALWP